MYQVRRPAQSTYVTLRDQRYHLRQWGAFRPEQTPLLMLHGWMDVSASFQFVVDAMAQDRCVIAPDWRGFGLTRALAATGAPLDFGPAEHYWFAEYLADLDSLMDQLNQDWQRGTEPFDVVGHSLGGNVAMVFAGVRPERVRRLVNLEGFGLPESRPAQAPTRLARWLDELRRRRAGELDLTRYDSLQAVAQRLIKTNPRLGREQALWLAQHWAAPDEQGRWTILGDAGHKVVSAQLYRVDETLEIHRRIRAPLLAVEAEDDSLAGWFKQGEYTRAQYHERLRVVADHRVAVVPNAGHMLHHDQPQAVAALIETHLDASRT